MKPKIKITLAEQRGSCVCHRGHKIGNSFDYDTERGAMCSMYLELRRRKSND